VWRNSFLIQHNTNGDEFELSFELEESQISRNKLLQKTTLKTNDHSGALEQKEPEVESFLELEPSLEIQSSAEATPEIPLEITTEIQPALEIASDFRQTLEISEQNPSGFVEHEAPKTQEEGYELNDILSLDEPMPNESKNKFSHQDDTGQQTVFVESEEGMVIKNREIKNNDAATQHMQPSIGISQNDATQHIQPSIGISQNDATHFLASTPPQLDLGTNPSLITNSAIKEVPEVEPEKASTKQNSQDSNVKNQQDSSIVKAIAHAKAEQERKKESLQKSTKVAKRKNDVRNFVFAKIIPYAAVFLILIFGWIYRKSLGISSIMIELGVPVNIASVFGEVEKNPLVNSEEFINNISEKISKQKTVAEKLKTKKNHKEVKLSAKSTSATETPVNMPKFEDPLSFRDVSKQGEVFVAADEALIRGDTSEVVASFSKFQTAQEEQSKKEEIQILIEKAFAARFYLQTKKNADALKILEKDCNINHISMVYVCLHHARTLIELRKNSEAKELVNKILEIKSLGDNQKYLLKILNLTIEVKNNPNSESVKNLYLSLLMKESRALNGEWLRQISFWALKGLFSLDYNNFYKAIQNISGSRKKDWVEFFSRVEGVSSRSQSPLLEKSIQMMQAFLGKDISEFQKENIDFVTKPDQQLSLVLEIFSKSQNLNPKEVVSLAESLKRKQGFIDISRIMSANLYSISGELQEGGVRLEKGRVSDKNWIKQEEIIGLNLIAIFSGKPDFMLESMVKLKSVLATRAYQQEFMAWYLYSKSLNLMGKNNSKSLAQAKKFAVDNRQKAMVYVEECEALKLKKQREDAFNCAKNGLLKYPGNFDLSQIASEFALEFGDSPEKYLKVDQSNSLLKHSTNFFPMSYTGLQSFILSDEI
jgi:hypothetical protein